MGSPKESRRSGSSDLLASYAFWVDSSQVEICPVYAMVWRECGEVGGDDVEWMSPDIARERGPVREFEVSGAFRRPSEVAAREQEGANGCCRRRRRRRGRGVVTGADAAANRVKQRVSSVLVV